MSWPFKRPALDADEQWHVIPCGDLRSHQSNRECWCRPTAEPDEPTVWVHHALDQREDYENGTLKYH